MSVWRVPDLGEGLSEVEILEWRVAVGDTVGAGQPLVTVETEKSVVDVASPQAGTIAALLARPGQRLAVGAPLLEFAGGEARDAGAVVGELPEAVPASRPSAARATPAIRALAQRLRVDLARVTPTGVDGTVRSEDVERAAREGAVAPLEAGARLEPLRGVRLAMARNMARAHAQVAPATVVDEADVHDWAADADVMARLVRALAAACAAEPALNAWYDAPGGARRLHARLDLGIAVQTDDGLFVPVLRDAAGHDAQSVRAELERLRAAVQARAIRPEEQRGPTLTLSNFGALGGRFASLVVVPPQVAIVGAGRIDPRVVARDGRPTVRRVLPLSLSFDHRVVTGGEAARFLAAARADLERAG